MAPPDRGWIYLHQLRDQAHLTRRDLAAQLPCSVSHLTNVENGTRRPSDQLIYRIAEHFGLTDLRELRSTLPTVPPLGSTPCEPVDLAS